MARRGLLVGKPREAQSWGTVPFPHMRSVAVLRMTRWLLTLGILAFGLLKCTFLRGICWGNVSRACPQPTPMVRQHYLEVDPRQCMRH